MPALAGDDSAAIDEYTKVSLETSGRAIGRLYGLDYAEEFHHIGPDTSMNAYIARNAVRL